MRGFSAEYPKERPGRALVLLRLSGQPWQNIRTTNPIESSFAKIRHRTATSPVAIINADVTSGKAPLTVNFSSDGSYDPGGGGITFNWDFGDGSAATEPNPQHVYTAAGNYTAMLTVTDDQGETAVAQVEITVRKSKGKGKP